MDALQKGVNEEFKNLNSIVTRGFNDLKNVERDDNRNVINSTTHKSRVSILGPETTGNNNSSLRGRKRSLSRGRGRGQSNGTQRGGSNRAPSRGPPEKVRAGSTPCPFCNDVSCPSPTKCAIFYDWQSRLAVHARKNLCPQYMCLKSHRGRCWKSHTCSYCEGRHHLAWCKEMAMDQVCSNRGSEPPSP